MDKSENDNSNGLSSRIKQELIKIYGRYHPTQFAYDICNRLKIKPPEYYISLDSNNISKCIGKLHNYFTVEIHNQQKSEAKKIASEKLIIKMLNHKNLSKILKYILINDFHFDPISITNNEYDIYDCSSYENSSKDSTNSNPINNSPNNLSIKHISTLNNKSPSLNDLLLTQNKRNRNKKKNSLLNEGKGYKKYLLIENYFFNFQHLDLPIKEELITNENNLLNFELFALKWESNIILDNKTWLKLHNYTHTIKLIITKFKPNGEKNDNAPFGSFDSYTIRLNHIEIDYYIQIKGEITNDIYLNFISFCSNDFNKEEIKADIINKDEIPQYIQLVNKDEEICKLYFYSQEETINILKHRRFIEEIKMSSIQEICIKIIKNWRREKGIIFLNPIIIEFIIMRINYDQISKVILSFMQMIDDGIKDEYFTIDYHIDEIKKLKDKKENFQLLQNIAKEAIEYIEKGEFEKFFISNN